MSDPFIGEIRLFAFGFTPHGWATCSGQLLSVTQNSALFSLLGTTYGGDGRTTFALPDLRGRIAVGTGHGQGLTDRTLGETGGSETVQLTRNDLPAHNHSVACSSAAATSADPNCAFLAAPAQPAYAAAAGSGKFLNGGSIEPTGGGRAHPNMPPMLVLNYCIALEGIFPARA